MDCVSDKTIVVMWVSDWYRVESEMRMNELVDWNDPIANQLEELLLSNLQAVFHAAIKQIVELGYGEEVAHMGKNIEHKNSVAQKGELASTKVFGSIPNKFPRLR
ncbi:hypothetical protein Ahy_A02g006040 [Arachis hypogaea]|uniref:Uncharacterized protein n=1 Tax=Arachis hypogaea TaxID=3818 RepID=A0A445E8S3_ARAHY|nr:hypothetical protein Ahy_A02g006040 [Arachis hypogaea]